jgi:hypothetical protein
MTRLEPSIDYQNRASHVVRNDSEAGMARRRKKAQQDAPKRRGRPRKAIDLTVVCTRLRGGESLRSVSRSLMVSHATILAHLRRAKLMAGFDY